VPALDPNIVFFVFLPPVLWAAAFFTSLRDFNANRRPIALLAVGSCSRRRRRSRWRRGRSSRDAVGRRGRARGHRLAARRGGRDEHRVAPPGAAPR
jgi:hypothetical protein